MRLIDLVAPIGKGQRGLIVAASESGKDGSAEKYRGNYRGKTSGDACDRAAHR